MEPKWIDSLKNDDNIEDFFDQLDAAANLHNNKKEALRKELENSKSNFKIRDEKNLGLDIATSGDYINGEFIIQDSDRRKLYCELLYTIKHKIGKTIANYHISDVDDLKKYVKIAFPGMTSEEHLQLLELINVEKPPVLILTVEIVEAKNLVAKDANGFSDPYCMLGIVNNFPSPNDSDEELASIVAQPNTTKTNNISIHKKVGINRNSSNLEQGHKSSFIKRFSSFRRSEKSSTRLNIISKNNKNSNSVKTNNKLSAKYIQATSVKKTTLDPVWNEKFKFQVNDIHIDVLHIDLWDHDDEVNVLEAVKKLNEVKGLKGLDRYFKQIAQSARTSNTTEDGAIDDFLGSIDLRIKDLPSNGSEEWYLLESGTDQKSRFHGEIKLRMKLSTVEDRGNIEDQCFNDLEVHEHFIKIFMNYELGKLSSGKRSKEWKGLLCREAETILHQHAVQNDLNELQIALCRWVAFAKIHLEKEFSYEVLAEKLDDIDRVWKNYSPSRKETDLLRDSFTLILEHCYKLLNRIRKAFPITQNRAGLDKLSQVLKLLSNIYNMPAFKYCFPFQNTLSHELTNILKNSSSEWLEKTRDKFFYNEEDQMRRLVEFLHVVYIDLFLVYKYYTQMFENMVNIPYLGIVCKKVDLILYDLINKVFIDEFGEDIYIANQRASLRNGIKPLSESLQELQITEAVPQENLEPPFAKIPLGKTLSNTSNRIHSPTSVNYKLVNENSAVILYDLYNTLKAICQFKSIIDESDLGELKIISFYEFFYLPYESWIDLITKKINVRIKRSFELEKNNEQSMNEICSIFNRITTFWTITNWPNQIDNKIFFKEIIEYVLSSILHYSSLVQEQNHNLLMLLKSKDTQPTINLFLQLMLTANDIHRIRDAMKKFVNDMLEVANTNKTNPELNEEVILTIANNVLLQTVSKTLEIIVDYKITCEFESFFFYLFESPESATAQEGVSRLLNHLNAQLCELKSISFKISFDKLIKILWARILDHIELNIISDKSRSRSFFTKMNESVDILINFFSSISEGRTKEYLKSMDKCISLKTRLSLQTHETTHLIQMFYQKMAQMQSTLNTAHYGKFLCQAYYINKKETLVVEVIKCKNLVPMDQNGLSDPYVEIELKPEYLFQGIDKKKTTIVKSNLNPVFNEKFEFKISRASCLHIGSVIAFTIMDHDIMWSNDFEGEAFIELSQVPGVKSELGDSLADLVPIELYLTHPKDNTCQIYEALEYRETDKQALEFLKLRRL